MVHVFKSGRMMFKHKNKFFHFQKHYLFIIFKFFLSFFGGWNWQIPWGHSCVFGPCGQWEPRVAPLSAPGRQGQGSPASGHVQGSRALGFRDGQGRKPRLRNRLGGTPWHAVGVGWAGRETQWTLFSFFAFIFIKEKGACQLSSLCYMILYVVLFLFCFVNCIIFKYLSFKKRRKTTKKNLVKALRRG